MNRNLHIIAGNICVVIPVYNKAKYIDRCIQSVLNQTVKPGEIIVVDDGSTDDSLQILSDNYGQEITLVSQVNAGKSVARNNGVDLSKSGYIAFLDGDDEWAPEYLENIASLMEEYPECSIYSTAYLLASESERTPVKYRNLPLGFRGVVDDYFDVSLKGWSLLSSSSSVVDKQLFYKVGKFTPGLDLGEDLELWCKLAMNGKIAFLNEPLSLYHYFNDSSVTRTEYAKIELPHTKYLTNLLLTNKVPDNLRVSIKRYIAKSLQHLVCENAKRNDYSSLWSSLMDRRMYQHFGGSTLKMILAVVVPVGVYNRIKRISES